MAKDFSDPEARDRITDWQLRVLEEREELAKKIVALQTFIVSEHFWFVAEKAKELMHTQLFHMQGYEDALRKRIDQF